MRRHPTSSPKVRILRGNGHEAPCLPPAFKHHGHPASRKQFLLCLIQDTQPVRFFGHVERVEEQLRFHHCSVEIVGDDRNPIQCRVRLLLGLVRKNSMVKFDTNLLSALRQAYHGNGRLRASSPRETLGLLVVSSSESRSSVIHPAHSAARRESRCFLLRMLGDRRLGHDDQSCNGCSVLEGRAHDLGRIDDAK